MIFCNICYKTQRPHVVLEMHESAQISPVALGASKEHFRILSASRAFWIGRILLT